MNAEQPAAHGGPARRPGLVMMRRAVGALLYLVALGVAKAATAGGGWYLLIPPRSEYNERAEYLSGYKILTGEPLSAWTQESAYDSAADCEAAKATLTIVHQNIHAKDAESYISAVGSGQSAAIQKLQRWTSELSNAIADAYMSARCIRSDDLRLRR